MTTIYLAMIADRHTDTEARPFSTPEAAINFARKAAHENCRHAEDFEESHIGDWLYHATYSVEGDSVWVVASELDATS